MAIPIDSTWANLTMGELVRASGSLTIWIKGHDLPVEVTPGKDVYMGILTLGPVIMARFYMAASGKVIHVNIVDISRVDAEPPVNASQQATSRLAPVQEG